MNNWLRITAITVVVLLVAVGKSRVLAQSDDTQRAVQDTVTTFLTGLGERDAQRIRSVVNETFVVIEASDKPRIHIVDAANDSALLPPDGNTDWQGIQISEFKVDSSATPGVATVSFKVSKPLDKKRIEDIETILEDEVDVPNEVRSRLTQAVKAKAHSFTAIAMLARQDTGWKLVSIALP